MRPILILLIAGSVFIVCGELWPTYLGGWCASLFGGAILALIDDQISDDKHLDDNAR